MRTCATSSTRSPASWRRPAAARSSRSSGRRRRTPTSPAYRRLYSSGRRELAYERLTRARERGEIRDDVDVRVLVDQLWGAVYHRLLVPDEPVTPAFLDALVDNLFDGVAPR